MGLYQMDPARILQVYVAQGAVCVIFLVLASLILNRGRQRLNLILSGSYFTVAIGLTINIVYASLPMINIVYTFLTNPQLELIVLILYYMTLFFLFLYPAFLLCFILILLKSEKIITTSKQIIIILVYAVILSCMVFIPNGVEINASTDWKPVWSWFLFIYVMGVVTLVFIPSLYFAVKIYKKFEEEQIRKKWRYFLIGLIGLYIFAFGTLFSNALNIQTFRTIWSIISLILVLISPVSIYLGVGKQIGE